LLPARSAKLRGTGGGTAGRVPQCFVLTGPDLPQKNVIPREENLLLQSVLTTLVRVIVPLAIPVLAGALLVRFRGLETKNLVTLILYFLLPFMVFDTLTTAEISAGDMYKTIAFCLINLILMWGAAVLAGRLLKLPAAKTAGLTLISTMTNCVNYGLPLVLLAFGQAGLDKASVFVVTQLILGNTVGVFFAARSNFSVKNALKSVFTLPSVYAVVLAVIVRAFPINVPAVLETGINMVAKSYSPVVLAILGAQMVLVKNTKLEPGSQAAFWAGMSLRIIISPIVASLVLFALGIRGMLFSVVFILSSMPVAVNSVLLAEKFDAAASVVSKCILWTTLSSFVLLPVLIEIVK
jgi:predicted permease